jgi:hypothetical protein
LKTSPIPIRFNEGEIDMHKKKLLTLMVATLLPFGVMLHADETTPMANAQETEGSEVVVETADTASDQSSSAEMVEFAIVEENSEPESRDSETTQAEENSESAATESAAVQASDRALLTESGAASDMDAAATERWNEREQRYQVLRKRAEEAGVMLPAHPSWLSAQKEAFRPTMQARRAHHQKMMAMSPEERDAYRQERYQEMREKAQKQGVEIPETPAWAAPRQAMEEEWARHQEVIEKMTPEERAACHAMHRRHMGYGVGYGHGCGGAGNCPGPYGNPAAMPAPVYPGYGRGPAPAPGPYGQGNFWDPSY